MPVLTLTADEASNAPYGPLANVQGTYSIAVVDTAANVSQYWDILPGSLLLSIDLTDVGTPTLDLSASDLATVTASKVINSDYSVAVTDDAYEISQNFDVINENPHVSSITISDDQALDLTVTEILSDGQTLSKITNSYYTISASGTVAQAFSSALAAVSNVISVSVTDTAENILTNFVSLQSDPLISSITAQDTSQNILAYGSALQSDDQSIPLDVLDSAANVSADIDALNAANISSVTLTDGNNPVLTLDVSQYLNDTNVLYKITNNYSVALVDTAAAFANNSSSFEVGEDYNVLSISIVDSAADFQSNVDALAGIWPAPMSVTLTDAAPSLTMSADDAVTWLGRITNTNLLASVVDTSANVAADLDQLSALSTLTAVTLSDQDTPIFELAAYQVVNDANVLSKITNSSYDIVVSDTISDIQHFQQQLDTDPFVTEIDVVDGAADILSGLGNLQSDSKVKSVEVVDSAATILQDSTALANVSGISSIQVYVLRRQ